MIARTRPPIGNAGRLLSLTLLVSATGLLTAADAPTGGEPGVYAFVLSNTFPGQGGEGDSCKIADEGDLERFYKSLPPTEQAKYAGKEKTQQLETYMNEKMGFRRVYLWGERAAGAKYPPGFDPKVTPTPEQAIAIGALNGFPKGTGRLAFSNREVVYSACSNPRDFPMLARNFRTYDGPVADGLNLDGKIGKEDFSGSDGTKGIDNQLWRAIGCVQAFRQEGHADEAHKTLMSARAPTLIEVRGVDDLNDDPDVTVSVYAAAEPLSKDGRGGALHGVTFTVDPDPRLRATTRGRIEKGVLLTDPFDLVMNYKEQIIDAPREIKGARIRAKLKPDGSIEGGFYGYYTLDSYYAFIEQMTQNGAILSQISCPGIRTAIDRFADGYRDKKTGRYTAISSAQGFYGVRAFVAPPQQTAQVEPIR